MESRHRLLRKRVEETTDRDPLVAWALALWLSRYSDPSYAPYREVAEAQLKAAREQGKMDSRWALRAKFQTDPVIAYALLQAAQWRPQGLALTWQEQRDLDILRDRLSSAAEERIVEFETHAALQEFDDLAQSNPGAALELAAQLDIPSGIYNHPYGAKLSPGQRKALQARVVALRIERDRLARRLEADQLEGDFRQRYEARQPEQAWSLAERLFAPPPDVDVPVSQNKVATTMKASRLRYARVELNTDRGGYRRGVVQSIHPSPLRIVIQDQHLPAEESNLSPPARLILEELAPPLPDDILHSPPVDFLAPEKRAWVAEAREELRQVLANPSGQRFWLLDFDDERTQPAPVEEEGPNRFALLELEGGATPPPQPPPPKPLPTPPRAEVDRALREFREGLARDARTQIELAGHTLVRRWKLLTTAEQDEVRAGLAQLELRRSSRFANLEVAPARLVEQLQPGEGEVTRFGLLEFDDGGPSPPPPPAAAAPGATVKALQERWRRLTGAVHAAARVEESYATAWLERNQRRLFAALGGRDNEIDAAIKELSAPPAPARRHPPLARQLTQDGNINLRVSISSAAAGPSSTPTAAVSKRPADSFSVVVNGAEHGRHAEGVALLKRLGYETPNRLLANNKDIELAHQLNADQFHLLHDHLVAAGVTVGGYETDRATRINWINKDLRAHPRPAGLVHLLAHGTLPPMAPPTPAGPPAAAPAPAPR